MTWLAVPVPPAGGGDPSSSSVEDVFGDVLLQRGLVDANVYASLVQRATKERRSIQQLLQEEGLVGEADLVAARAVALNLEYVDFLEYPVDVAATRLVTEALARRYRAVPVGWTGGRLLVAMVDPTNVIAIDDIRTVTGAEVQPGIATQSGVLEALGRYYRHDGEAEDIAADAVHAFAAENSLSQVREVVEDGPIVKLVNVLITQAIADRASDIHIEPAEEALRVRYRIDGVLHEVMSPPSNIQAGIISRIKVMAEINIAERRIPQDGRITTQIDGRTVDLRVATLPTVYGEKIVMRVLDQSTALLRLTDLGFLPENMVRYEESFRKPYGTVLVTGPTGSGKSTTLYATLNILNDVTKNVITVEDPVEYQLDGINQVQVNPKAGLSFAAALRSILRCDPDIVLVGEIRDRETAVIAVEAALTGHMVLSTLHTNDAASTPGRLIEMGVEPFLVGSALDCVVAQRLARRLCPKCKSPYQPDALELKAVGWNVDALGLGSPTLYRPVGCGACGRTGYHGRFAIHEVLQVTEEVERIISERGHSEELRKAAEAQGMLNLREVGLREVASGRTSLEEVLRVVS
jgi:type IV pilus assembly protein PilB